MSVVRLFLRTYESRGDFGQLPSLGLRFQHTENRSLRRQLALDEGDRRGLLVVGVSPLMPVATTMRVGDVVVRLDGLGLAEDGTVEAMEGLRLPWEYCITAKTCGEVVELELLRDGYTHKVDVRLAAEPRLVPLHDGVDASPSYVIVGGLVFLELSLPLVDAGLFDGLADPLATGRLLAKIGSARKIADESVVVLASILESELTISYDVCAGRALTKFNGEAVRNLRALAAAVQTAGNKPYLHFEFDEYRAVIETARSKKGEAEVLRAHDIPSWCSKDVDPRGNSAMAGCITAFSLFSK
jgi:hypothetical protein